MNVLVVGAGGREHALAWKISHSNRVDRVFCAPGNAGIGREAENVSIAANDFAGLIKFAQQNRIELVVVGPEQPLCDGLVDELRAAGIRAFGPSRAAAQLEGSKVFCKEMLRAADVPTAEFRVFNDPNLAEQFVNQRYETTPDDVPLVVKADGLAAGKGVIVCHNRDEVIDAIDLIARQKKFGRAGGQIVIEERLDGTEASVLAITDGRTIVTLPAAQDHKPAYDGDRGPNTGGMGAAPLEFANHMGMPLIEGLTFAHNTLRGAGLHNRVKIGASGKLVTAFDIAKVLALGADWANSARGFMFALGCIQAQACHTNHCPVGVATQDKLRQRALHVSDKATRVARFHQNTLKALAEMTGAAGLSHPGEFEPHHIIMREKNRSMVTGHEVYPDLPENFLVNEEEDEFGYLGRWHRSRAESFAPFAPMV